MKLSKITASGLVALMTAAALGAVPVCAHPEASTEDAAVSAEKMAVQITTSENGIQHMKEENSDIFSFVVTETDNENSYSYTVKTAVEPSENADIVYTVTTTADTAADLTDTSHEDIDIEIAGFLDYQISFDETTSKIMISKDGGKTWKELPLRLNFKVAE